jgi:ubiquitin-protein ligase
MSGAAEGIAGLALSAVSVAALFTTCIQCFDIVVAGKNFSEDYEQLFAIFAIQRTRFGLWGESVGLIPNPNDGRCLPYNENIDRRDIRPGIESILNNIRLLLQEADKVDERYGLKVVAGGSSDISMSVGLNIFKDSFERFKGRIKKNQKQKSAWKVTRWAIHDATKFETLINRLEKYVDGLEKLTDSLGRLEERLREEIDSISDARSLRLLRDASSSHRSSSKKDLSDTASRRMVRISESGFETQTLATASITYDTGTSFVTAETRPSSQIGSLLSSNPPLPGAWPRSVRSESSHKGPIAFSPAHRVGAIFKPTRSCVECLEEHYKCEPQDWIFSCSRCYKKLRSCSFVRELSEQAPSELQEAATGTGIDQRFTIGDQESIPIPEEVPQNQRLLSELIQNAEAPKHLSFEAGDAHYGESLKTIKIMDVNCLLQNSAKFLNQASNGSSAAKRMFLELRDIRTGNVPFVSAAPIGDSLDKVLASIEGPPETPYEGGIFWIAVKLSDKDVFGPPLMRFHTKIYHPNISPQGHICADYKEKWNSVLSTGPRKIVTSPDALWYHGKSQAIHWSLGALLTALCGLLASPDVEDPLVPEIAQKYLTDYAGYCEAARLYTERYATGDRPNENDVIFLDDELYSGEDIISASTPLIEPELEVDTISIQRSLRETYDEHFPLDSSVSSSFSNASDSSEDNNGTNNLAKAALLKSTELYKKLVNETIRKLTVPLSDVMIETVWNKAARQWDYKNSWVPTHIDIAYGLLERIAFYIRIAPDDWRDVYIEYRKVISSFFAKLAIDAKSVHLALESHDGEYFVNEVVIAFEDKSGQTWVSLVRVDRFIALENALEKHSDRLTVTVKTSEDLYGLTYPSPETIARFLGDVLRLPEADLLATSQFVELVQPAIERGNGFVITKYEPHLPRTFPHYRELIESLHPSEKIHVVI